MTDIAKEIDELAEKMEKSVQAKAFSQDLIKSTILGLGPEALKKAVANLTTEQAELLFEVLKDLKKSHKGPIPNKEESLEPLTNGSAEGDYYHNEEKPEQTEKDEELAKEAAKRKQAEPRNQGGIPVEGWEGQVIKSEGDEAGDLEKGGSGSGRKPITPGAEGLESLKNLRARAEEAKKIQNKFHAKKGGAEEVPEGAPEKKDMGKKDLKNMMTRMQERKLEKSACVSALAKSFGVSEAKLAEVWDLMAKSDILEEKGNPEGSQSSVPSQMSGETKTKQSDADEPDVPAYTDKKAKSPEATDAGKPSTTADGGEQPPAPMKKSDSLYYEEEPSYLAKSEDNPFAVRTIKPNASYHVDAYIAAEALAQADRLSKSTFDYAGEGEGEALAKADDPTEADVVEANAKKKADAKKEDAEEVRQIKTDEKLTRIEGEAGPKMPFIKKMKKSFAEELLEKGLDMEQSTFELAVANTQAEAKGGFLVKSFENDDMEELFKSPSDFDY